MYFPSSHWFVNEVFLTGFFNHYLWAWGSPHKQSTAVKRVKPKGALKVLQRDSLRSTVCLFLERSENISPGENNLFIYLIFFHESTALYTITFVNSQSRTRSTRVQNRIRTSLQPLVRHRFSTLGRFKSRIPYFALRRSNNRVTKRIWG